MILGLEKLEAIGNMKSEGLDGGLFVCVYELF